MKDGSRTYNFENGFCQRSSSSGEELGLTMGTVVETGKPGSAPYFDLTVSSPLVAAVNADYGGKAIVLDAIVSVKGKIPSSGTFAQRALGGGGTPKFTGTWNCHGVVYNAP